MTILNKIRGLFKKDEVSGTINIEKIDFKDLYKKVDSILKDQSKKSDKLSKELSILVKNLDQSISGSIEELQMIDLKQKKEHEKIKHVVQENLNLYIANLKRLLENLNKIKDLEIQDHITKVLKIFSDFERSSHLPYQKATILIGKELGKVVSIIKNFSSDFNKLLISNKSMFKEVEELKVLKSSLDEISAIVVNEADISKNIEKFNQFTKENNKELDIARKKIEEIRVSEDYKNDIVKNEQYKIDLNYLENNISAIKQKINLKSLAKRFHSDKKRSQLISEYSKDFRTAIKNDEFLVIINLVKEDQGIEMLELKGIRDHVLDFESQKSFKTFQAISLLEDKIKSLDSKNLEVSQEIENENKRIIKLNAKKTKLIEDSKKLAKTIFPNLEII